MKLRFIVNPRSGRVTRVIDAVRTFAARHGATVQLTERPQHARELARRALADGCEVVAAVGGDGTMNEVAGALVATGATFALVPCGSGNGLGRHLGIHGPAALALRVIETGVARTIDAGEADGHLFFTAAGLGFEAEVARRFNALTRRGFARYLSTGLRALREWQPFPCTVVHGGQREHTTAFTLAVANAAQYGNNARIAPAARVDDGLLDLAVIPPLHVFNALPLVAGLFGGFLPRLPGVVSRQARSFVVERAADGPLHTDGEIRPAGRVVEFRIRPGALRILAPA